MKKQNFIFQFLKGKIKSHYTIDLIIHIVINQRCSYSLFFINALIQELIFKIKITFFYCLLFGFSHVDDDLKIVVPN